MRTSGFDRATKHRLYTSTQVSLDVPAAVQNTVDFNCIFQHDIEYKIAVYRYSTVGQPVLARTISLELFGKMGQFLDFFNDTVILTQRGALVNCARYSTMSARSCAAMGSMTTLRIGLTHLFHKLVAKRG